MSSSSLGTPGPYDLWWYLFGLCLHLHRLPWVSLFPQSHFIFYNEVTVIGPGANPDNSGTPHVWILP